MIYYWTSINTMTKRKAFTIIELLIVLTIISALAIVFIPNLSYVSRTTDASILRTELIMALQIAQSHAQNLGRPITICPSKDMKHCANKNWVTGWLIFIDDRYEGMPTANSQPLYARQNTIHDGILFWEAYPRYRAFLTFSSYQNDAVNGTFWYCLHDQRNPVWAIVINKLGRVRIVLPNADGEIVDGIGKKRYCTTNKHALYPIRR